jgi:hypothetical protein
MDNNINNNIENKLTNMEELILQSEEEQTSEIDELWIALEETLEEKGLISLAN